MKQRECDTMPFEKSFRQGDRDGAVSLRQLQINRFEVDNSLVMAAQSLY